MLGAAALIAAASAGGRSVADQAEKGRHGDSLRQGWPRIDYPAPRAIRSAQEFATSRGDVSFAVMDDSIGLRARHREASAGERQQGAAAGAELRRLDGGAPPLTARRRTPSADDVTRQPRGRCLRRGRRRGVRSRQAEMLRGHPGFWGVTGSRPQTWPVFLPARPNLPGAIVPTRRVCRPTVPGSGGPGGGPRHNLVCGGWRPAGEGHLRRGHPPGGALVTGAASASALRCSATSPRRWGASGDRGRHRAAGEARPAAGGGRPS